MALAVTHYYLGDFARARQEATSGVRLWHSGVEKSELEELDEPIIGCLCHKALCAWHSGQIASADATMKEAIIVAKRLGNTHGIAVALHFGATLRYMEQYPIQVRTHLIGVGRTFDPAAFSSFSCVGNRTARLGSKRRWLVHSRYCVNRRRNRRTPNKGALLPLPGLLAIKGRSPLPRESNV